jgi:hypothetical protein
MKKFVILILMIAFMSQSTVTMAKPILNDEIQIKFNRKIDVQFTELDIKIKEVENAKKAELLMYIQDKENEMKQQIDTRGQLKLIEKRIELYLFSENLKEYVLTTYSPKGRPHIERFKNQVEEDFTEFRSKYFIDLESLIK